MENPDEVEPQVGYDGPHITNEMIEMAADQDEADALRNIVSTRWRAFNTVLYAAWASRIEAEAKEHNKGTAVDEDPPLDETPLLDDSSLRATLGTMAQASTSSIA